MEEPFGNGRSIASNDPDLRRPPVRSAFALTCGLRFPLAACLLGLAFPAIWSCRPSSSERIVLECWAIGAEGDRLETLLKEFHERHPQLQVNVQQIPWTAAHEKLLTAFAGHATPDLCQLGNTWIPEFAALGSLEELTPRVQTSSVIDPSDYFPGIWQTNVMNRQLLGIPWYVDTRVLFYRRDLLSQAGIEAPPTSWTEWRDAMTKVQAKLGSDRFSILLPTNEWEQIVILGLQTRDPLLRQQARFGNFRSAGFRRAFHFYLSLFRDGLAPIVANTEIANVWLELARGTYAMYITGPWNMGEFRRRMTPEACARWATAPLPAPDGQAPGLSLAGGCSLVVFRRSRHAAEAWKVIEFLSDPEMQVRFYGLSGNLPARKSSWDDESLRDDPWAAAFAQQLECVTPTPLVPEWEQIATRIYEVADRVIRGSLTEDQGLEQLDHQVDGILEKRRWVLQRKGHAG